MQNLSQSSHTECMSGKKSASLEPAEKLSDSGFILHVVLIAASFSDLWIFFPFFVSRTTLNALNDKCQWAVC